jgi:hypothetical protein
MRAFVVSWPRGKIRGAAKRLAGEIYVASEASATPLQSYALQSNL